MIGVALTLLFASWMVTVDQPSRASAPAGVNGRIAFSRHDPTIHGYHTFTINPDGSQEVEITPARTECQSWSPDGSTLLVCTPDAAGFLRPATSDADGTNFTVMDAYPDRSLQLACRAWSPDAARLVCGSDNRRSADNGIYTVSSKDGGDLVRVTSTPEGLEDIAIGYSADGSRILFLRNDPEGNFGDLFVVNPDGSDLLRLDPPPLRAIGGNFEGLDGLGDCCGPNADWSPDGTQVVFGAYRERPNGKPSRFALWVVNVDGTNLHRITPLTTNAGRDGAKWSPDGQLIAFSNRYVGPSGPLFPQIWVVHPDGSGMQELTHPTANGDISVGPMWSPDSTKIVFLSLHPEFNSGREDLWTINIDGTGLMQLTSQRPGLSGGHDPTWGSAPAS
jgi:Tol biopolymer transport system component